MVKNERLAPVELQNLKCGLSVNAVYPAVFKVFLQSKLKIAELRSILHTWILDVLGKLPDLEKTESLLYLYLGLDQTLDM